MEISLGKRLLLLGLGSKPCLISIAKALRMPLFGKFFAQLCTLGSNLVRSRSTKPRVLCLISPVLFSQAISLCSIQKIDMDVLNNGVSYFLGPLLNWTLVGVVKTLLREIQQKG